MYYFLLFVSGLAEAMAYDLSLQKPIEFFCEGCYLVSVAEG